MEYKLVGWFQIFLYFHPIPGEMIQPELGLKLYMFHHFSKLLDIQNGVLNDVCFDKV